MLADLRHSIRSLAKSPGYVSVALITLALGIGVNTSMFSALSALLFRTPYPDDGQLVRVFRTSPQSQSWPHSPANFADHRAQSSSFAYDAAINSTSFNLAEPDQPAERLYGMNVTADFFPSLGIRPQLGRVFAAEEDQPGKNGVVVISHATWLQRFGGDPGVVGRQIRINAEPVTVIGVMPSRFDDPMVWGRVDAWRPMAFSDKAKQNRGGNYLGEIARLKPGVSLAQAQTEMTGIAARLAQAYPDNNAQTGLRLVPLARSAMDGFGSQLTWFVAGLAGFVLLIACANLANLQLARHAARERERAIRAALGASRGQLIRAALTESLLLSLAGGLLGLLVAAWSNHLIGANFTLGSIHGIALPLDGRVLAFAFAASVATGLMFGALPAWLFAKVDVNDALKQGGRGAGGHAPHRLRHLLIVSEVALALVLLAGAGFFLRGLERFTQRDPGWKVDGLLTGYVNLRGSNYANVEQRRAFNTRLEEKLAALPGVEHVAISTSLPTWGFSSSSNFVAEGRPEPAAGTAPLMTTTGVTPDYFTTLGLRLVQGRFFTAADQAGQTRIVIINESLARAFWPNESAIGKRIGGPSPFLSDPQEIVGVVSDAGAAGNIGQVDAAFQSYHPLATEAGNYLTVALRAALPPEMLAVALRRSMAEIDPDQPIFEIGPVRAEIDHSLGATRLAGYTLGAFALLGVLLAAVGIYGVISGYVTQRTNEIGIRMALGAQVRDILALVLGRGLRLTLLGAAIGLAGAFGVARLLGAIAPVFGIVDSTTVIAITAFLLGVATLACWLPARRAAKVDPMTALRTE